MEKAETPGASTTVLSAEPSPQSMVTVLVCAPPGLTIVPPAVIVPPSSMLDCDSTSPGAANVGAGSLRSTTVCASAVSSRLSLRVTPITKRAAEALA